MDDSTKIVELLRAVLGDAVRLDDQSLETSRTDKSGWVSPDRPLAVVVAQSVADVQTVLRIAHELHVPVVPRGTGTGLAGGAISTKGSIVLSVAELNHILEIVPEDGYAVVEPGVLNGELNAVLEPYGLWFAPDPASKAIASVGGNIATNAGGLLCAKYGVTREAVLGLTIVLADGTLLETGRRTVKGVTGYDLTALFVGSEGTLGVIVGAVVKVLPLPVGHPVTLGATFPDIRSAAAAAAAVSRARLRPAVMELIDPPAMAAIAEYHRAQASAPAFDRLDDCAYLLVQFDGSTAEQDALVAEGVLADAHGDVRRAHSEGEGEELLAIRRSFHPSMEALGTVLIEDVCVPRSAMPAMFDAITDISARYGISIPTVAHAGDGNLHPNFVYQGVETPPEIWAAADELFRTALSLGGTLTGEHGVGVLKRKWLAAEVGDTSYELQRSIKQVFDPAGILNPGKIF